MNPFMNTMQCMAKYIAFQNEDFKRMYDVYSKINTDTQTKNLLRERTDMINFAKEVYNNNALLPATKQTYLRVCYNAITQCDEALKELGEELIKDKILSEIAQMFPVGK